MPDLSRFQSVPLSANQLGHCLVAVQAALTLILDDHPDIGDAPRNQTEQLVVVTVHQLALVEDTLTQALGQPMGYARVV